MVPGLGEIRQMEQLAASEDPTARGAWWIMLQTAESICNYASLRDPINNACIPEFWSQAAAGVETVLGQESARPLPYDDILMYNYLKYYKIPVTIVATKVDKIGITLQQKQRNAILDDLELVVGDDFIMFSSVNKTGKEEVMKKIENTL